MNRDKQLFVFYKDRKVGMLAQTVDRKIAFAYDDACPFLPCVTRLLHLISTIYIKNPSKTKISPSFCTKK